MVRRIGERYEKFAINFLIIFRLKATWFLSRQKLEQNLMHVLTHDARYVIRELLFHGKMAILLSAVREPMPSLKGTWPKALIPRITPLIKA